MPRYRKKPVEITALQLTNDNAKDICDWIHSVVTRSGAEIDVGYNPGDASVNIDTLEGTMRADVGDWVIQGVQGEFYPCKPDIFAATYDPVDTDRT